MFTTVVNESVPTVYPQNLLSNLSSLPTQQTTCSPPRKKILPR